MPRFFFHLYDDAVTLDAEGQELSSDAAARTRAIESARDLACAEVRDGHLDMSHRIEVQDHAGRAVATVHFRDAVTINP